MTRLLLVTALILASFRSPISWTKPGDWKEYQAALEKCRKPRRGVLLYIREENEACRDLEKGHFANPDITKLMEPYVCIRVEKAVVEKLKPPATPAIVTLTPEGHMCHEIAVGTTEEMIEQLKDSYEIACGPGWCESTDENRRQAVQDKKPIALFIQDQGEASEKALQSLGRPPVTEILESFMWMKREVDFTSEAARQDGLTGPAIWILDPKGDDFMKKPVAKIAMPIAGAKLKSALEAAAKLK